jgi:hypothetical protein
VRIDLEHAPAVVRDLDRFQSKSATGTASSLICTGDGVECTQRLGLCEDRELQGITSNAEKRWIWLEQSTEDGVRKSIQASARNGDDAEGGRETSNSYLHGVYGRRLEAQF